MSSCGAVLAGIDIGGTSIKVALVDADYHVVAHAAQPTPAGGKEMAQCAADLVVGLLGACSRSLAAAGVGAAGAVDPVARMVTTASASFTDWAGFPVGQFLDDALGVPTTIANDVNAFLVGEVAGGAGVGLRDAVGITLGTGVGGALMLDGRLFTGPDGLAGEIGHTPGFYIPGCGEEPCTCGQVAHLESIASGRSIAARYARRGGRAGLSAAEVYAASGSDAVARAVLVEAGSQVGKAAVMLATVLSVTDVIVGGGVVGAWPVLKVGMDAYLRERPAVCGQQVRLHKSRLGRHAVALGAAEIAGRAAGVLG